MSLAYPFLVRFRYMKLIQAVCKNTVIQGYTQRPNIHALLHLADSSEHFGNLVNISCFPGEAKHRPLKRHARKTNNQGVDKQLLRRINTLQTVRFVINGAFMDTHETITQTLRKIQNISPRIFGTIAPVSLIAQKGGIGYDGEELPCAIPYIQCLRMGLKIKQADLPSFAPVWAKPSTWIRGALKQIYNTNPRSHLPPTLGAFRITYYKRITFVSLQETGSGEKYHVFKTNNMAEFQGGLCGKIISFFKANICGILDYFILIQPLYFHHRDRVLDSSVWRIGATSISATDMPVVVPLMYLEHVHPMFIPYAPIEDAHGNSIPQEELIWRNDWYTRRY